MRGIFRNTIIITQFLKLLGVLCQIGKFQKSIVYFSGKKPSIHCQENKKFEEQEHPTFFYFYNIGNKKSDFNNNKNAYYQGYQNPVHFPNVNQIIIQKNG